jgi:hypothetical protein
VPVLIAHPLYFAAGLAVRDFFDTICMLRFLLIATFGTSWLHLARRAANISFERSLQTCSPVLVATCSACWLQHSLFVACNILVPVGCTFRVKLRTFVFWLQTCMTVGCTYRSGFCVAKTTKTKLQTVNVGCTQSDVLVATLSLC